MDNSEAKKKQGHFAVRKKHFSNEGAIPVVGARPQEKSKHFSNEGAIPVVGARPQEKSKHFSNEGAIPVVGARPQHSSSFPEESTIPSERKKRKNEGKADLSLININLLFFNNQGEIDCEIHPPLGPLYLISYLQKFNYTTDFIDHQAFFFEHPDRDAFNVDSALWFYGELSDIVGLSCMANLLPFTLLIAEAIKKKYPEKTILLGGVGPFGVEYELLKEFPHIDVIARGEGEETLLELVQTIQNKKSLHDVLGIHFRSSDGQIIKTDERPRLALDELFLPAYDHIDLSNYDAANVITNRGCPYPCSFCSVAPIWNHRTTFRKTEHIIAEIRMLNKEYGIKQILFQDEFFYSGEKKMLKFCDAIEEMDLDIEWKCFGRVNLVTEKAMKRMAEVGCTEIRYGIESGSDSVLSEVTKKFSIKEAVDAIDMSLKIFPAVEAFFIWGFPFEDMNDFLMTAIQMERLRDKGVNVLPSLLSFLPQTEIYKDYKAGKYNDKLTFDPKILPIFVVTGHEVLGENVKIPEKYQLMFNLVEKNPNIFPGFYLYDIQNNVLPKKAILEQMGFA